MKRKEEYIALDAQMFHFDLWINQSNPEELKTEIALILEKSKFTIVNFIEHHFPVKGYTAVWLLAESHLAIHTFPDQEKTYLQISSCNNNKLQILKEELSSL
ncbi:S-adenosylmethionine decarboxylase [Tenacibaculum sp. 190524A05c]|uniref:S-adenosylmethionine decarboxylase n=1 Tax=Tenacibaculum platacis TaxID=3137852 RepID=UPI0031FB1CB2